MNSKAIAGIFIAIAVIALGWWLAAGHAIFTATSHMVQVTDPLFGTTTTKWQPGFQPGLDLMGPIAAVAIIIAIVLMVRANKRQKSAA